jgi:hypothetical protein
VSAIKIPEVPPLFDQDITIMRCTTCNAILPGTWGITRKMNQVGIDHYLERHLTELSADSYPRPPIVNCTIQDPFWFDEHAPASPGVSGQEDPT